jgi:hypothetical protein
MNKNNEIIKEEVTVMFEDILHLVQVAVPGDRWFAIRSKILKKGNDCIRNLQKRIGKEE